MSSQPEELLKTLANHDAAINTLGGRMSGVETSVHKLQGEVHTGFAALGSKLDKMDAQQGAQPKFDVFKALQGAVHGAVLLSMIVGGIYFVVNGSFSGMIAKQEGLNSTVVEKLKEQSAAIARIHESLVASKLKEHGDALDRLAERTQWLPTAPKRN